MGEPTNFDDEKTTTESGDSTVDSKAKTKSAKPKTDLHELPTTIDQPAPDAQTEIDSPIKDEQPSGATARPPTFGGGEAPTVEHFGTSQSSENRTKPDRPVFAKNLPTRIARYQTLSVLGEGAFGVVLKCIDPQLDRDVAVKLAKFSAVGSDTSVQRFMREAKSAAQLRHPNIVPVFEYGEFENNHYIAYQFVEGITLQQLRSDGIEPQRAVELMIQIAEGMDYAHGQGIIHRDLKPANILIDKTGTPHIADFGCARQQTSDVTHTVEGSLLGTPAYMCPEVAAGRASQADARSDIWSLGVMLYELLVGVRPFRGNLGKILAEIQTVEPTSIRQIENDLPVDLDTIVMKCLQKDPQRRFQSGHEFAAELRRWLENRPILSRRINPLQRMMMWSKRNPKWAMMWSLVAVTILSLLFGSIYFTTQLGNKQRILIQSQLGRLQNAEAASVPVIIESMQALDASIVGQLKKMRDENRVNGSPSSRLELAILKLQKSDDAEQSALLNSIAEQMVAFEPNELSMFANELSEYSEFLSPRFWSIAISDAQPQAQLRAACTLATMDPQNEKWSQVSLPLIGTLLGEGDQNLAVWLRMLKPAGEKLKPELEAIFRNADQSETRALASRFISSLFASQHQYLARMAIDAEPEQLREIGRALSTDPEATKKVVDTVFGQNLASNEPNVDANRQSKQLLRRANQLVLSALLDDDRLFRAELLKSDDPSLRTELIHRAAAAGLPVSWSCNVIHRASTADHWLVIAALQMLGSYGEQQLYLTKRETLRERLISIFKTHPDCGVHSNAQWLLQSWKFDSELAKAGEDVRSAQPRDGFSWHEDKSGLCFAIFDAVDEFEMGQPGNQVRRREYPFFHRRKLPRRFGISTTEITRSQYLEIQDDVRAGFVAASKKAKASADENLVTIWKKRISRFDRFAKTRQISDRSSLPMVDVSWVDAAVYCAELCRQNGLSEDESPYKTFFVDQKSEWYSTYDDGVLERVGYRLPTAGEYEYAARALAKTRYHFGNSITWMSRYAWTNENSFGKSRSVASLKPNHFGLFDVLGNVAEWTHDPAIEYPVGTTRWTDGNLPENVVREFREVRDSSFNFEPTEIAVYDREANAQNTQSSSRGFRIARTYPPRKRIHSGDQIGDRNQNDDRN